MVFELGLRRVWTDYVHSAKKAEISRGDSASCMVGIMSKKMS